jgi:molybdenum cofactor sulfurtransferase
VNFRKVDSKRLFDMKNYSFAYNKFLVDYPLFKGTSKLDLIRKTEFSRLDADKHIYLDYTGGGLYAEKSQVTSHVNTLLTNVFGNPHSINPSSRRSTDLCEEARRKVLHFFNADPDEYCVIFTPNASGALKIVGESYPFESERLLCVDNHNSMNGIREFAKQKGADVNYFDVNSDLRVDEASLIADHLSRPVADKSRKNRLFAYPAQSNFSGNQHPLSWIETAHSHGWDVLVDCAAFVPSNRLDLSIHKPDFIPISFYKIFGYPTGLATQRLVEAESDRKSGWARH